VSHDHSGDQCADYLERIVYFLDNAERDFVIWLFCDILNFL
jgi:hypothetical protein